jgi:hypothetical protein
VILKSKVDSYVIYKEGGFGNKLRTWANYEEFSRSGFSGLVSLRYHEPASPYWRYNIPANDVPDIIATLVKQGADFRKIVIGEMAPDEYLLFQGELMRSVNYFDFCYSREQIPMREALKNPIHTSGIEVVRMLRDGMTGSSFEDLDALLDLYPDSIIELSVYSRDVGSIPDRNALIWEVRNY